LDESKALLFLEVEGIPEKHTPLISGALD